jgi:hypothetical protein
VTAAARRLHHRSNTRLPRHPRRPIMTPILTLRYSARRKRPRSTKGRGEIAGPASRGGDQLLGSGDSWSQPASLPAYICHYFQQNSLIHSIESFLSIATFLELTSSFPVLLRWDFTQHIATLSFLCTYLYTNITWQNLLTCLINCRVVSSGTANWAAAHYASLVRRIHGTDE